MQVISVIVPVYNASGFIVKCLDSIVHQTFNEFELIIVDDGSTDNSLEVCREYAQRDERIEVYHKENGGQTSARRYGFERSSGKYIYFVDADDFLPSDALEILLRHAEDKSLDIVDGASISYFENLRVKEHVCFGKTGVYDMLPYLHLMFQEQANNATHACLIKRTAFNADTFDIPNDVRLGEDIYIHLSLVLNSQRIGIFNDIVYYYMLNSASITHRYKHKSVKPVEFQIEGIRKLLNKHGVFGEFKDYFYRRAITNLTTACINNRKLLSVPYVRMIANEALHEQPSGYVKALCYFLKYPILYPFFWFANQTRRILTKLK